MNGVLPAVAVGILFVAGFLLALAAYSLRDFSRSRLAEICKRRSREKRFGEILKRHEDVLLATEFVAAIVLTALIGVALAATIFPLPPLAEAADWLPLTGKLLGLAVCIVLAIVVLPWTIARVAGEPFLFRMWPLLCAFSSLVRPLLLLVHKLDGLVHRLADRQLANNGVASTITDEIKSVVDEGQREGVLESEARSMIHRVMELQEEDAAAIMTPRIDMVCIRATMSLEEAREQLLAAGHSRIPVIGETTDDIVGILYAKDLLKHVSTGKERSASLKEIVREPYYVPETTGVDTLLENMKRKRVHLAIVVDEYGGVAGLVSMEDILEEIVGEIVDEYDSAEETGILNVSPGIVDVESRVHIDDLNEQFHYGLPEDGDFDTIGGFVFHELGRIPTSGESFAWKTLRITVQSADQRSIHKLRIEENQTPAAASSEET